MKVGFLTNQLDNRGTGNATFSYAHYNEILLKNKSTIFTFENGAHNSIATQRFERRFGDIQFISRPSDIRNVQVLYHIKSGADEGFRIDPKIRYSVHAVFEVRPHADRYAAVSRWLANQSAPPTKFVPHIIDPAWSGDDFRKELAIPRDAVVIGRHGGYDSFDISWVWDTIEESLNKYKNLHYVFMNTNPHLQHPKVHYIEDSPPEMVRRFLNTCDAMIHARARGETFGVAVGEFAVLGKPVMTYSEVAEKAHIDELGDQGLYYSDSVELLDLMGQISRKEIGMRFAYLAHTPHNVMQKFKEVFLD